MKNPNDPQNPMARQTGLVVQEMPDEVLVYDLDTNKAHCLNESAAFIWSSCDGKNSVMDIVQQFESNGRGKVTEDFVWLAIDQLNENNLLENKVAPRFPGHSRRQVLKTIGLASMVAIPVIASLVAPNRAYAVANCACASNVQCGQPQNANCPSTTNCNNVGLCAP
ncbi:MAG: PqqD family protein [Pyrinomonadaceae bacterium]